MALDPSAVGEDDGELVYALEVAKTEAARCERCWRHREDVGSVSGRDDLCPRCAEVVPADAVGG